MPVGPGLANKSSSASSYIHNTHYATEFPSSLCTRTARAVPSPMQALQGGNALLAGHR